MERLLVLLTRFLVDTPDLFATGAPMFDFYLQVQEFTPHLKLERDREVGRSPMIGTQWYERLRTAAEGLMKQLPEELLP
jgi:hypothetical protein